MRGRYRRWGRQEAPASGNGLPSAHRAPPTGLPTGHIAVSAPIRLTAITGSLPGMMRKQEMKTRKGGVHPRSPPPTINDPPRQSRVVYHLASHGALSPPLAGLVPTGSQTARTRATDHASKRSPGGAGRGTARHCDHGAARDPHAHRRFPETVRPSTLAPGLAPPDPTAADDSRQPAEHQTYLSPAPVTYSYVILYPTSCFDSWRFIDLTRAHNTSKHTELSPLFGGAYWLNSWR